jgi:putative colanic acid biosynthesis glycosyltransferase
MKIVQINSFSNGSTGSIMMNIHNELLKNNIDSYVVWGRGRKSNNNHEIFMNDKIGVYFHALYVRFTGRDGFASHYSTKKLLKKLDEIKPDIVHLHNIHGYYINIEMLFNYLKTNNIKVIWTLHDCWAITGHCAYFTVANCNKWMTHCNNCPIIYTYPKSLIDNSYWNYEKKMRIFDDANITIVTPSNWLSNIIKKSFLNKFPLTVINNGINTAIFKPTLSNFREKYNLKHQKIILGVANVWDKRKGLDDFIDLSKIIDDNYKIVLVGLSKKQINNIPVNILGLERTKNPEELAKIYSAADILFNPTHEENYPTVNLEANACGIPVVTYNTGGSPETVKFGIVTNLNDFKKNYKNIIDNVYIKKTNCCSINNMVKSYLNLYNIYK